MVRSHNPPALTRVVPICPSITITKRKHEHTYLGYLHPRELQRGCPTPQEHPVHEHPVFAQASQIEISTARSIFTRRENLQVSPGYEARVAHADVHGALRRVPPDGHRAFLHQVFEFSALQPGDRRPRQPANHRHLKELGGLFHKCLVETPECRRLGSDFRIGTLMGKSQIRGESKFKMKNLEGNVPGSGTAAPTHRRNTERKGRRESQPNPDWGLIQREWHISPANRRSDSIWNYAAATNRDLRHGRFIQQRSVAPRPNTQMNGKL